MKEKNEELKEKARKMTDEELHWKIFGQCFQDDTKFLLILQEEQSLRVILKRETGTP